MLHYISNRTEENASHFVVLVKVTKDKVIYLDPAKGKIIKTIDNFFEYFDGLIVLLYPKNTFFEISDSKKSFDG